MLVGKKILVTGATSGIGLAAARLLTAEGAKVFLTGRNEGTLQTLGAELGSPFAAADLAESGSCARVVDAAATALEGLTTLVNCAGVLQGGAFGSPQCTLDNFMYNFNTNTKAVFEMMQHSTPHLKAAGPAAGPSILNISSVNGKQSFGGCASYCASKAAVDMLTKCAAVDLAEFGIRVNGVSPGVIMTELQKRGGLDDAKYEAFVQRSIDVTHPLAKSRGAVGAPVEVANIIAFLISDKAAFITGDMVVIDGGRQCLGAR